MERQPIETVVLKAIRDLNLARDPHERIEVSSKARIFGGESPLDSIGLVALLIDIEDAMAQKGYTITLMDEKAMSQQKSPFRDVQSLVSYLVTLISQA